MRRDVEQVERLPDVGRRAFLPGVGHGQESLGPGPVEDGDEVRGRVAQLGGVEPDRVQHVTVGQGRLERRHRRLGREVAQEAEDEPRRDPEVARRRRRGRWAMPCSTASKGMPRSVWVWGSKNISAWRTPSACGARQVGAG